MKIAVYAISKNEQAFVERFCKSAELADYIVIADTGSTDNTVQLAQQSGAQVHQISIKPWRFDKARDVALALVPPDADVCISLDLDEVLEPGWREEIERVWKPETTRLRYKFDWGSGIAFYYEKIHHRVGYHWHHPCHEYPVPDVRTTEVWAHTDKLLVTHHPDPTKSRGQYLDLLHLAITEDPQCPRNGFYYARELSFYQRWQEAIDACNRYLKLPGATWNNERAYAYRVMSDSYWALGDRENAIKHARLSCCEAPGTREPWMSLAMLCYQTQQWEECFASCKNALAITNKELVYTMDPKVWGSLPHDLCAISAYNLGLLSVAKEQITQALVHNPQDARLLANQIVFERQT
jgi:tetratricopeptide (TPR) repeat protein